MFTIVFRGVCLLLIEPYLGQSYLYVRKQNGTLCLALKEKIDSFLLPYFMLQGQVAHLLHMELHRSWGHSWLEAMLPT